MNATTDTITIELRSLLRRQGFCLDPQYLGETRRLSDVPRVKKAYLRKHGLSIDAIGESLWSNGLVSERPDANAVLELMEAALMHPASRVKATADQVDSDELTKSIRNRLRKFECPSGSCGAIARGARHASLICGRCYELDGEIVWMTRRDKTADEVMCGEIS